MIQDPGSSIVEGNRCYGQPRPSLEQPGEMELEKKMEEKDARINEFVTKILAQYPPEKK